MEGKIDFCGVSGKLGKSFIDFVGNDENGFDHWENCTQFQKQNQVPKVG
jgi:hypothetical protein